MNKLQWNFNQNKIIFIQENDFENVACMMSDILFNDGGTESLFTNFHIWEIFDRANVTDRFLQSLIFGGGHC